MPLSAAGIPEPRLQRVDNETPFEHFECQKMAVGRRFFDTVVVKATLSFASGGLTLAEDPSPIALADEVWDVANAERSSLRLAGDVVLMKPGTDVMVTGTARAPGDRALGSWDCAVEVFRGDRPLLAARARALGPRWWRHTGRDGWVLSEPAPTRELAIRYERAYGGAYPTAAEGPEPAWAVHRPNPSGTGFFDEAAMDPAVAYPAPQWELPEQPVARFNEPVDLCGFGPVARPWAARLGYAGTYDEAWIAQTRADVARGLVSDYAADFDPRFFQCAHPALIAPGHLRGDEAIVLTGLLGEGGPVPLPLPGFRVSAALRDGRGALSEQALPLDTVHVSLDDATLSLCWRLSLDPALDIQAAMIFARR
jgi:hypothetical protein